MMTRCLSLSTLGELFFMKALHFVVDYMYIQI